MNVCVCESALRQLRFSPLRRCMLPSECGVATPSCGFVHGAEYADKKKIVIKVGGRIAIFVSARYIHKVNTHTRAYEQKGEGRFRFTRLTTSMRGTAAPQACAKTGASRALVLVPPSRRVCIYITQRVVGTWTTCEIPRPAQEPPQPILQPPPSPVSLRSFQVTVETCLQSGADGLLNLSQQICPNRCFGITDSISSFKCTSAPPISGFCIRRGS